jgi:tetratricopeptide (TPR) repeat protein
MSKKTSLFRLIKSLTGAEKRYFLQMASKNKSESNYITLFRAIEEQEQYDEALIKATFKDRKFATQLHVTKINLTELILRALKSFHARNSVNATLLELLREIEILFAKELFDLCFLRLEKALSLTERFEKFPLQVELLTWHRKLIAATSTVNLSGVTQVLQEEKRIIGKIKNLNGFWNDSMRVYDSPAGDSEMNAKEIYLLEKAESVQAKILHHHFLFTRYYITGKQEEANQQVSKLIQLLENNPAGIEDDPTSYITAIMNKVVLLLSFKRWKELPVLLSKVSALINSSRFQNESQLTVRLWIRLYNVELEMYRDTKELEKGMRLIGVIQSYIQARKVSITTEYLIMFYFQFASIYFLAKDFSKSLKWINEIINTNFGSIRLDIQKYTRILILSVHFELGNISLLQYATDSSKRFLKKNKIVFQAEELLLQLFSKIVHLDNEKYSATFKTSLVEWQALDQGKRAQIEDYVDVSGWLKENLA